MKRLYVRCDTKEVFQINRDTLDAMSCARFDPWCYSDPEHDVEYMEWSAWALERNRRFRASLGMPNDSV